MENRVLGAGPPVVDPIANAAFYFGLVRALARVDRPLWSQMSFSAAEENFHSAARDGIGASLYWPGYGEVGATELTLRALLPLAHEGLTDWGVGAEERDRYLGIIEQRCVTGTNGASWFIRQVQETGNADQSTLRRVVRSYREHMLANEPVHTWR